jgi:hypothetical protein
MSFTFQIRRATKIMGVVTLDGVLDGSLKHGTKGTALLRGGESVPLVVKTVAFVDPPRPGNRDRTITIEPPPCALEALEGATLVDGDAADIKSIRYDYGNSDDPVSAIGRIIVELASDGSVSLRHQRGARQREWSARQQLGLWQRLVAMLSAAAFPSRPSIATALPPGTSSFSVACEYQGGTSKSVSFPTGVSVPGYREISGLMFSIVAQISGEQVLGFKMPPEESLVSEAQEIA